MANKKLAERYMARNRRTVVLPSGAEFKIRLIPPIKLTDLFDRFKVDVIDQKSTKEFFKKYRNHIEFGNALITEGVVNPRMTEKLSENGRLSVHELSLSDATFLVGQIMELCGFSNVKGVGRSFRNEKKDI